MTKFDEEDLEKLNRLCRLGEATDEEKKAISKHLKKVLGYMELLSEVDTTDVPTCYQVGEIQNSVTRDDTVMNTLSREQFLENAPSHLGSIIRVPTVINFSN
ncbi:Glutamyl-tRNA(Gln) amidotransferase subunit C [Candidatus Rhabdochlamydia oedothoracis]|uniref:Aspartyl/glutamyl-tRNA(Asn/Gln) amidotransferase subunit C n=1 Tax=Candidatus Rhabdochlamydia oedothoracis TaxID=2720720 RepID=A0ABX8V138_9BACT|nr:MULTISPECIES: Asp-tRNA(Asn)/Glu-tRNA(Gln) amidotransferase subunit GatC [Rhabdochlamydia]KAG6558720.1 Glutamyl-tRNA(Gln) amidotransferase subunit C [Candidatus Rhabdochlamydia sp. W815]MCL6755886.1 Asp-tRNA(Asn)/Glu-tRNA(Gln) amidotransferase subunit GatC [Candidatus Rhabdochlamydia oedothoracis]QYF48959.1 Glutamyl-tRNA(Gln) amidotransferase subunit C [Candidatus Rhabdochlamydia oedothoracis]